MKNLFYKIYSFLYFQSWNFGLWSPPDRKFLNRELLPFFARSKEIRTVLFVGVRRYTKVCAKIFSDRRFITIDNDPKLKRFGSSNHITDDVRNLSRWRPQFSEGLDLIVLNGVIGFGLNDKKSVEAVLEVLTGNLRSGGWLVVGGNPLHFQAVALDEMPILKERYTPAKLGSERQHLYTFSFPLFPGIFHQYRFFSLKSE
jgi:hypothetical protein